MRALARALLRVGTVAVVLGAGKLHASMNVYDFSGSSRLTWSIAFIALLVLASYGAGLPDLVRSKREAVRAAMVALGTAAGGVSVLQLFVGDALLPRFVVGVSTLVLMPWYLLCTTVAHRGRLWRELRDRVVLVGNEEDASLLRHDLQGDVEIPASLVATLQPAEVAEASRDGELTLLRDARSSRATLVVLSREAQAQDSVIHQAGALHEAGIRVRTLSMFYEQWLGKLPVTELERVSLLYDISEVHRQLYGRVSRLVDLALGGAGVVVLVPLLPIVLIGNALANRGPLFYRQPRVGKNGVEFSIVKFRTMRVSGVSASNEWTTEDDPRITPFGRVLRKTHLDELPQLVNIVKGDLSLVGPRPEQPHYVEELKEKLPFYDLRHLVRPGLTGWAQVKYGYAGTETDALQKLQYEFYYLRHQSLALDLKILFRTLRTVVGATGR